MDLGGPDCPALLEKNMLWLLPISGTLFKLTPNRPGVKFFLIFFGRVDPEGGRGKSESGKWKAESGRGKSEGRRRRSESGNTKAGTETANSKATRTGALCGHRL
jgi:hypothetical protein